MSEKQKTPMEKKKELRSRVKELKPIIPKGSVKNVAEKLGLTPSIVSDTISGRRWNLEIVESLIEIGEKELKRIDKAISALDKIREKKSGN